MKYMCVFCKIISGEFPSYKVYEDDKILAFLSIDPISPGHTLVVTKEHFENLEEINEDSLKDLILKVKEISVILKDKLGHTDYAVSQNNGALAGQTVFHIHFHIIPRVKGDNLSDWKHTPYLPGEAEAIMKKINA